MMGRSHMVIGAVTGTVVAMLLGADDARLIAGAGAGAVGGLAPDVDQPQSRLGRWLPRWWHRLTPGHRGVTHSLVWVTGLGIVVAIAAALLGVPLSAAARVGAVAGAGAVSHLAGDGLTHQGVPWLWPWRRQRYALAWSIRTGGPAEGGIVFVAVVGGLAVLAALA